MTLLSDQDRQLMQDSVDKFITEKYPFEEREHRVKSADKFGVHWPMFAELGWLMLPFSEDAGGMGGGIKDAQVLARAFGRGLIAEPWLEVMLAGQLIENCTESEIRDQWLHPLVSGESRLILAHGEKKSDLSFSHVSTVAEQTDAGFCLNGTKRVVWQADAADYFLVSALLGEAAKQPAIFVVSKDAAGVSLSEFPTVDSRYAADLHFADVVLDQQALLCSGDTATDALTHAIVFAFGVLVAEIRGIVEHLISLTSQYLNTREQFGTTIGNFQALQHMLADMVIAKEEIHSLEYLVADMENIEDLGERERIARSAKARATMVGRTLCETGIQLHGGIGLSDEYVASHYLRRLVAIDALFGDSQQQMLWLAGRY